MGILDFQESCSYRLPFSFLKFLFILKEREITSRGGAEKKEAERIPSRLHTISMEPDVELKPTNHEIIT